MARKLGRSSLLVGDQKQPTLHPQQVLIKNWHWLLPIGYTPYLAPHWLTTPGGPTAGPGKYFSSSMKQLLGFQQFHKAAFSHAYRMVDMGDPTTKFWVKKVVDSAGSHAKMATPCKPITL